MTETVLLKRLPAAEPTLNINVTLSVFDILGSTGGLRRAALFFEACHLLSQALEYRSRDCLQTVAA